MLKTVGVRLRRWGVLAVCLQSSLFGVQTSTISAQRLNIAKDKIDVGRTGYQMPVTATFELRNKGLRRLVIDRVLPDCSCTKVEYPKDEIGMGDKFTIKMTYDARTLGHFNKQVAIFSNATRKPVYLTMTGVVMADLQDFSGSYPHNYNGLLADKNELEFDDVNKGDMPVQEIHIMNNSDTIMQPNLLHLPPYLAAVAMPERLAPGRTGKITVTLNSDKLHGFGLTQTNVYLAQQLGEKVRPAIEMGVSAVLLPDMKGVSYDNAPVLELSDSVLNIDFNGRSKRSAEVLLANNGRALLDIQSLQLFTMGLKVTLGKRTLAPGEKTKLKIKAYGEQLAKARSKPRVLMITNDPNHAKVVIKINAKF